MSIKTAVTKVIRGLAKSRNRNALRAGVGLAIGHEYVLGARPWNTIVDIGANKGQFALAALDIQPNATIHSFEPLAGPRGIFDRVLGNAPKVHLHPFAVGPEDTAASMHVAGLDHSSSLLPIGEGQTALFPKTREVGEEEVAVRRLDTILTESDIQSPALLKLDVQGFEYEALNGCETLLPKFDIVYAECSFRELYLGQKLAGEIIIWLAERGFVFEDILGIYRDGSGKAVQGDFLFRRYREDPSQVNGV